MKLAIPLFLIVILATAATATVNIMPQPVNGNPTHENVTGEMPIDQMYNTDKCYLLQPKAFVDAGSGVQTFGLILSDVEAIAPELTILNDPFLPYDPVTNPSVAVNYTQLYSYCLAPMQRMKQSNDIQQQQIAQLQQDNLLLKQNLCQLEPLLPICQAP